METVAKIGFKFCGGCNYKLYDRASAAKIIMNRLKDRAEFVSYKKSDFDIIIVIMGCHVGCTNLTGYDPGKIRPIKCISDAFSFTL